MKKVIAKYPVLGSSVDPAKLSLTLKGLAPLVVSLAALKGIQIEGTDLDQIISSIVAVVSGLTVLYGFGRRVYFFFKK